MLKLKFLSKCEYLCKNFCRNSLLSKVQSRRHFHRNFSNHLWILISVKKLALNFLYFNQHQFEWTSAQCRISQLINLSTVSKKHLKNNCLSLVMKVGTYLLTFLCVYIYMWVNLIILNVKKKLHIWYVNISGQNNNFCNNQTKT